MHKATRFLSQLFTFTLAFALVGGLLASPTVEAKPKKKRVVTKSMSGGRLFVATEPFPTQADSLQTLIRKGRRHSQKKLRWLKGSELSFNFLIVLRKNIRIRNMYMVLYRRGKKKYVDAQVIPISSGKLQFMVSRISFANGIKKGGRYQLRAVKVRTRGRTRYETVLAKASFRVR